MHGSKAKGRVRKKCGIAGVCAAKDGLKKRACTDNLKKTKIKFTKMHGCGNDYIYINCFCQEIDSPQKLAKRLCDRHKGIGGDGIILICPSEKADAKMRIFNLDGSEGKMCGNGIRCVGKYIYEHGIAVKSSIRVETLSGIKTLKPYLSKGKVTGLCVDMGAAELTAPSNYKTAVNMPLEIDGTVYKITCVSMGNLHCVIFVQEPDMLNLNKIGPLIEKNPLFPEGTNAEFVSAVNRTTIKMRVWERGSGETFSCGTGACAAAVAAAENGLCDKNRDITVKQRGGELTVRYTEDTVYLTGDAVTVFEGETEI